ncbi:MAG TPA: aminotransferase class V-fold PLP-dependent enzyme [Thermoanaerobaculia bacterium]|nr:aminotransferase class V-fold PLP-dependent enzyme [Thermoanaerobaculia bacterium]
MTLPLEPDSSEMRRLVDEAMVRITRHLETLPEQPAGMIEGSDQYARTLIEPLPVQGADYNSLLDFLFNEAIPRSFNTAGPGYLAYIPGGGLFHSAVADLIADSVNRYVGVFAAAPALVQLESNVIRWFCEIFGFGEGSGGILTTGGSLSNFGAVVAARKQKLPEDFLKGTLYASDQVHHSLNKAASLAGFPAANVREIPTDENFRIRTEALEEAIQRDRKNGFTPFFIAGSAGTTSTGAVDDLDDLAAIAQQESMWFHVDGAYGGFFVLTEQGRKTLRGMEKADSIVVDPHKTLFLPYGTGALLVRDGETLRRAHSLHADYLPDMQTDSDLVDFCEISPELSRDFRGLRIWLPLKMFGIEPFREQLEEKLRLTQWAAAGLRQIPGIEIVAEPQLSIVAFRLVVAGRSREELDALNRELLARINGRQRVMLTPTIVSERFVLRICVVSFRTHQDRMEMALEDIRAAVDEMAEKVP